jgi:D-glycero-D-manno-heptose 1,7-bisphosphate phosphatase
MSMVIFEGWEPPRPTPLLCLDLDGTVRQGPDDALGKFVNGPEDVRVFPEAVTMMHRWKVGGGGRIIAVSNQGGIALGHVAAEAVRAAMIETFNQSRQFFDRMQWCSHHPDAQVLEMTSCWCRKPLPGLIIEQAVDMARDFNEYYPPYMALMVGDRPEDEECARLAGISFQWAAEWRAQAAVGQII